MVEHAGVEDPAEQVLQVFTVHGVSLRTEEAGLRVGCRVRCRVRCHVGADRGGRS
ncbi:hypothetical protein ACFFX0_01070 [Citricoccus parietis]|uniref:Uncharacterized protein n=1 Tax=Citricoccus parietis TaxID=592307 RepID=A0ABV5FT65_9MICC